MPATRTVRLNGDTNLLKLVAIVAMLIDHVGARLYPQYRVLREIGRLAFPLFAYCMAAGCVYTRNIGKYALRVLVFAAATQPIYMIAMSHAPAGFDWLRGYYRVDLILQWFYSGHLNILFSLFLGILVIWTVRDGKYALTALLAAAAFVLSGYIDYGSNGIILMALFYAFIDKPLAAAVSTGLFMLYMGLPAAFTNVWFLGSGAFLSGEWLASLRLYPRTQIYALAALPLIICPMKSKVKIPKYFFYAFYPGHLLLIHLIKTYAMR